jgi:cytidylate kinase
LDRLVDDRTRKEAAEGRVVLDGLLSAWIAGEDADLKFFLFASDDVRLSRIARRDRCSLSEAKEATYTREELERDRFKRFYGFDIDNHSIYDLMLNTGLLSTEGNAQVLESFVRAYLKEQKGEEAKCQPSISGRSVSRPEGTKKGRSAS